VYVLTASTILRSNKEDRFEVNYVVIYSFLGNSPASEF